MVFSWRTMLAHRVGQEPKHALLLLSALHASRVTS
jgi:hypothetical protein